MITEIERENATQTNHKGFLTLDWKKIENKKNDKGKEIVLQGKELIRRFANRINPTTEKLYTPKEILEFQFFKVLGVNNETSIGIMLGRLRSTGFKLQDPKYKAKKKTEKRAGSPHRIREIMATNGNTEVVTNESSKRQAMSAKYNSIQEQISQSSAKKAEAFSNLVETMGGRREVKQEEYKQRREKRKEKEEVKKEKEITVKEEKRRKSLNSIESNSNVPPENNSNVSNLFSSYNRRNPEQVIDLTDDEEQPQRSLSTDSVFTCGAINNSNSNFVTHSVFTNSSTREIGTMGLVYLVPGTESCRRDVMIVDCKNYHTVEVDVAENGNKVIVTFTKTPASLEGMTDQRSKSALENFFLISSNVFERSFRIIIPMAHPVDLPTVTVLNGYLQVVLPFLEKQEKNKYIYKKN